MSDNNEVKEIKLEAKVFQNSGTQYFFRSLTVPEGVTKEEWLEFVERDSANQYEDDDLKIQVRRAFVISKNLPGGARLVREACQKGGTAWQELKSEDLRDKGRFIRYRIGSKKYSDETGQFKVLYGIWFAFETNTGSNSRGLVADCQSGTEINPAKATEALKHRLDPEKNVYMQLPVDSSTTIHFNWVYGDDDDGIQFKLELKVLKENGNPVPVDLVLDLGNSRTVALILEHGANKGFLAHQFADKCLPIRLKPSPWDSRIANRRKGDDCIVSSTIVLQTPQFETGDPNKMDDARQDSGLFIEQWQFSVKNKGLFEKATEAVNSAKNKGIMEGLFGSKEKEYKVDKYIRRRPQMFVRLSPVVMGDEAMAALDRSAKFQEAEARFVQSSPKRYYWDLDKNSSGTYWNMLPPPWKPAEIDTCVPRLQCELMRYMPADGSIRKDLNFDPSNPQSVPAVNTDVSRNGLLRPRAETLTWMLLALLERAWEQANVRAKEFHERVLKNVIITYPSGWLPGEVKMYRERCQEAVNIFAQTNFDADKQKDIKLVMEVDEAIASQMPYVFTEISQFGNVTEWVRLVGKGNAVRIMNLDIGGGTTDYSIIEYRDDKEIKTSKKIKIDLKFKDGFAVAGDDLLRVIIDRIIIRGILKQFSGNSTLEKEFLREFRDGSTKPDDCAKRSLQVQRVLSPLAIHFLSLHNNNAQSFVFSPEDAGISAENWRQFLRYLHQPEGQIPFNETIAFSNADMKSFVEELFESKMRACARYAAAYDVDLLVLSGKTSEIPEIAELIRRVFPLPWDRVMATKNYRTGKWYPNFDEQGDVNVISDAKTVTAVGAALHFALTQGLIDYWSIETKNSCVKDGSNIWSVFRSEPLDERNRTKILGKEDEQGTCIVGNEIVFYRQTTSESHPEPVYMFKQKDGANVKSREFEITIQRVKDPALGEKLQLVSVFEHGSKTVAAGEARANLVDSFEIILHPAGKTGYAINWQESGLVMK